MGFLNVAIGIYALTTNRLPPLVPVIWRDRYEPRRYGWGVLLMAVFVFLLVLGQKVLDWSPDLALVLVIPMIGCVIAACWLLIPTKPSPGAS
ncbi:hypothetical protein [Streptosporangium amethystogenes]|uniref:hypothetical protein n=1 Tax=Streptosporangium amethystogenes TaxID=2002 RepID=UPI0012F8881D|nr:hypothetical protein [Streptosporangium amethystogenes]